MSIAPRLARNGEYVSTTLLEQLQDRDQPWNQEEEISDNESDEGEDPDAMKNGLSTALRMRHDLEGHLGTIWSQKKAQLRQPPIEHFFSSS